MEKKTEIYVVVWQTKNGESLTSPKAFRTYKDALDFALAWIPELEACDYTIMPYELL